MFKKPSLKIICRQIALFFFVLFSWLQLSCHAADIALQWDANTEPDIEGYVVHYKTGSSGEPYEYIDTVPVAELNDPDRPEYVLAGLDYNEDYFIVVTAYNSEGIESVYSNEVNANIPSPQRGGGDGGGCFISAAR